MDIFKNLNDRTITLTAHAKEELGTLDEDLGALSVEFVLAGGDLGRCPLRYLTLVEGLAKSLLPDQVSGLDGLSPDDVGFLVIWAQGATVRVDLAVDPTIGVGVASYTTDAASVEREAREAFFDLHRDFISRLAAGFEVGGDFSQFSLLSSYDLRERKHPTVAVLRERLESLDLVNGDL